MIRAIIVCVLLSLIAVYPALAAPVQVTVSINMNGKSDNQLRVIAKNKAILDALDKLPAVVWGTESSDNGMYTEAIKSIGFAQADVSVTSETFDRAEQRYTMEALVQWDQEKILSTLSLVQQGQNAKKTLEQLKSLIDPSSLKKYIDQKSTDLVPPNVEAEILVNPMFYATSFEEYKSLHLGLVTELAIALSNKLIEEATKVKFTLVSADSFSFKYRLTKPETNRDLAFNSDIIEQFFKDNEVNIRDLAGQYCLFSPTYLKIFRLSPLESSKAFNIEISMDTDDISQSQAEYLFKGAMPPFDILLCDKKSLEESIDLRSSRNFKISN